MSLDEIKRKIKIALTTDTVEYDDEIKEFFTIIVSVDLWCSANLNDEPKTAMVMMNDIDVEIPLREMSKRLSRWLTRLNKVYLNAETGVFYDISGLEGLNVGLVDFGGLRFTEDSQTLLENSRVDEIILPKYIGHLTKLEYIFVNVEIKEKLEIKESFSDAKITEVGQLFPRCTFSKLNLTGMDFSNVSSFSETFSEITANKLILPLELGSKCDGITAHSTFRDSDIKEIVNLDAFPFDKATNIIAMFAGFTGMDITINSSLKRALKSGYFFWKAHDIEINLPNVESFRDSDIFNEAQNCKIFLPRLKKLPSKKFITSFKNKINDSNELFVSEIVGKQLLK